MNFDWAIRLLATGGFRAGLLLGFFLSAPAFARDPDPSLEAMFELPLAPAGMTTAPGGTFLLSLGFEQKPENRVIEVTKTGESRPFPTAAISRAEADEPLKLDAVQGMQVDKSGIVWMLDSGRRDEQIPKIVAWDCEHKRLHRVLPLTSPAILAGSNLNDLEIDPERAFVFVSDPAGGADAALIVVDVTTGLSRRVLQGHPSVVPVTGLELLIDGRKLESKRLDGSFADPMGAVRPFALDRRGEWLYFGPLRSTKLYRVKTEHLRNAALAPDKLAGLVEEYCAKPICAGISIDSKGNIYVSDLASNAIGMIAAGSRQYRVLVTDPRLIWPDGLCFGADGRLHFFTNARNARPKGARAPAAEVNYLFRMQTPASGRVGD